MSKIIVTIFGATLALIGLGGIPIYAVEKNLVLVGVFTGFLIAGIVVLGYASKS